LPTRSPAGARRAGARGGGRRQRAVSRAPWAVRSASRRRVTRRRAAATWGRQHRGRGRRCGCGGGCRGGCGGRGRCRRPFTARRTWRPAGRGRVPTPLGAGAHLGRDHHHAASAGDSWGGGRVVLARRPSALGTLAPQTPRFLQHRSVPRRARVLAPRRCVDRALFGGVTARARHDSRVGLVACPSRSHLALPVTHTRTESVAARTP